MIENILWTPNLSEILSCPKKIPFFTIDLYYKKRTQLLLYFKFFIKFMEKFFLWLYKKLHDTFSFASWPAKLKIFPMKIILLYKKKMPTPGSK